MMAATRALSVKVEILLVLRFTILGSKAVNLRDTTCHMDWATTGKVNGTTSPKRVLGTSTQKALKLQGRKSIVRKDCLSDSLCSLMYLLEDSRRREQRQGKRCRPRRTNTRGMPSFEYVRQSVVKQNRVRTISYKESRKNMSCL